MQGFQMDNIFSGQTSEKLISYGLRFQRQKERPENTLSRRLRIFFFKKVKISKKSYNFGIYFTEHSVYMI
jgi:hypothetical protein